MISQLKFAAILISRFHCLVSIIFNPRHAYCCWAGMPPVTSWPQERLTLKVGLELASLLHLQDTMLQILRRDLLPQIMIFTSFFKLHYVYV